MLPDHVDDIEILDFDPFGAQFRSDPQSLYPMMVSQSPGFFISEGVLSAFIGSHAHNQAVLRNFKGFSSSKPAGLPGMERLDVFNGLPVMNYSDPPEHTRRRKVVNPAFTPKRTAALNEATGQLIDQLLDDLVSRPSFDAMEDFCRPIAIDAMLKRFMGIPEEDHYIFTDYVKSIALLADLQPGESKPQAYLDAWEKGADYCRKQQELAKTGDCGSLIGVIADTAEGGAIDDQEMLALMLGLLIGGVSTTSSGAAVALLNIARTAGLAARIQEDPGYAGKVLEESLRLDPPISLVMRFATNDAEIGGKKIPTGTPVYCMVSSACHDPAVFPGPSCFDPDRPNLKDHMAFGHGMHTCLGNAIVRNIVPMLLNKVVQRMPNFRLADREDALQWDIAVPRVRHIGKLFVQN